MTARAPRPLSELPWFKFHVRDWQAEEGLAFCSIAARGLWIELMCLMHQVEPYGHLLIKGKPPTDRQLNVLLRVPMVELVRLMQELEDNDIFSRTDDGIIFSRRMVRDAELHEEMSNRGQKGAQARYKKEHGKKGSYGTSHGRSNGTGHSTPHGLESESDITPCSPPIEKHVLPDDWAPVDFGPETQAAKIAASWDGERFERELESFKAHHRRKKSRFVDWQDAWGSWVRNAKAFDDRDRPPGQPDRNDFTANLKAELEQRDRFEGEDQPKRKAKAGA